MATGEIISAEIGDAWQGPLPSERARSLLNSDEVDCSCLGDLIKVLEAADPSTPVRYGFGKPDSYRGDYCDVAFAPVENTTIGEMLEHARAALGATFHGYKGGEYEMGELTQVWICEYGTSYQSQGIGNLLVRMWIGGGR